MAKLGRIAPRGGEAAFQESAFKEVMSENLFNKPCSHKILSSKPVARKLNRHDVARDSFVTVRGYNRYRRNRAP